MSDNSVNEVIHALLATVESLDKRIDLLDAEQDRTHVEWQRDRAIHIRLGAQTRALLSMMAEMLARSGVSSGHVATCFRERFLHFQDQDFQETEKFSEDLAANIDTRALSEIPTDQGPFRPLFPVD